MALAVYPGSFDPITKGHLDVLKRACNVFDEVVIAVVDNHSKNSYFTTQERLDMIKQATKDLSNVRVDAFDGLTIEYAKKINATVLIRGLRAVSDFEYEMQLAQANHSLSSEIETIFFTTKPKYNFISSSTVKEIKMLGGEISKFVPQNVDNYFSKKIKG